MEIVFIVLNRLRGAYGYFSKVIALLIGSIFYMCTQDIYVSLGLIVAYIAGESFGWGKWFGGIYNKEPSKDLIAEEEGTNNGIHLLANLIAPQDENFYKYSIVALTLRGILWFAITLLPLVIGGYLEISIFIISILLLGIGFPLSVVYGIKTTKRFNFRFMTGYWEHSEVWYGLMQDILLILIVLNIK